MKFHDIISLTNKIQGLVSKNELGVNIEMDNRKFIEAYDKAMLKEHSTQSIGILKEKMLHAVLKNYFEPCEENHEIRINGFVADILNEDNEIIEIQTRQFNKLRKKLESFLETKTVTIVYPVASTKWLIWINEMTGELSNKRKSPKKGTPYEIFFELYKIKYLLKHENLKLCIVLLDIDEYRKLDGWSKDKKKGSTRYERIPKGIISEIYINTLSDYSKLIPMGLPENFTSKDFKVASGLSISRARTALNILNHIEAVQRVGKKGNEFIYQIVNKGEY